MWGIRRLLAAAVYSFWAATATAQAGGSPDPMSPEYWQRSREEALQGGRERSAQLDELLRLYLIPVDASSCPIIRSDAALADFKQTCSSYEEEASKASKTKGQGELSKGLQSIVIQCRQKYVELYVNQLRSKYTKADFALVSKQMQTGADVECLLAASHNASAIAYVEARRAQEAAFMRSQMGNIDRAIALTEPPPVPPERSTGQQALQALSLILSGMGQGLTSAGGRAQTNGAGVERGGCSSDYSCGVGFTCVKNNFSASGYCAKNVNAYGVQQFEAADPGSVNVKVPSKRDCQFDTQCPAGFRCEASSGACVR